MQASYKKLMARSNLKLSLFWLKRKIRNESTGDHFQEAVSAKFSDKGSIVGDGGFCYNSLLFCSSLSAT